MIAAPPFPDAELARFAHRADLWNLILATLAINILSLALPIMTLQVYDRILPNPGSGTLAAFLIGVCVAVTLEIALRFARAHVIGWNGAAFEHKASCEAARRVLGADLSKLASRGVGEQLHQLNAVGRLKDLYSGASVITIVELGFVAVFLGLIAYLASWLVLAPIAVLTVFVIHATIAGGRLRASLDERDRNDDMRHDFLIEALEGAHTIKSFALEREFERRYEHFEKRSSVAGYAVTEAAAGTFNIGMVFANVMIVTVIVIGAYLTLDGVITAGALIATVLLSGRLMQPVQRALALWARFQDIRLAAARTTEVMSTPQAPVAVADEGWPRDGRLLARGLGFGFGNGAPALFSGIDLALEPGQAIAITGPSGEDKSVLLKLLAGVLSPTEGEVLIDDVRADAFSAKARASHVGLLSSKAVIFRGSLRDNLTRFGLTPEKNARDVAALLKLDRDVAKLPSGFDTRLEGSSLDPLPPGLRQRIAIARALAPKPRIIIFDNADKDLDREGYAQVFDVLARLKDKVAMIIVSDDENLQSLATERRRLADGRLLALPDPRPDTPHAGYQSLRL
ncbi:MAG: ABC transporter transmembrane domain-containing protein [Maricaulaceae bacterium]|jgi:ATP-binding cassette subfamily C protein LapB